MPPKLSNPLVVLVVSLALQGISAGAAASDDQSRRAAEDFFEKKVRPVLAGRCFRCHGPDSKMEGGLRLDSGQAMRRGGSRGPAIQPGDADKSLMVQAIRQAGSLQMPPDLKLPPQEIADLVLWIQSGAPWPDEPGAADSARISRSDEPSYWAFQRPREPSLPAVKSRDWPRSPIDYFILEGLEDKGIAAAPAADKRTLIRRATFDLIGLPPLPAEIDAFLADHSPDAFARVVNRLLDSPHYGERWGRHWLDVARYADSNGLDENLAYANAYRYRDYVIDSFNQDLPYDRFVSEQLAGDLMSQRSAGVSDPSAGADSPRESRSIDEIVATGFLCLGAKMLAEDDPVKMEMDIVDEQLDTIGRTFLGLTLGCARCHDHKFDPIRMDDYYGMAGILKSTKTMDNFKVVARWHERPLGSKEAIERQAAHEQKIAAKRLEIGRVKESANDVLLREARTRVGDYLIAATDSVRAAARIRDLKPFMNESPPDAIVVEAEAFARGNVKRESTGYGEKIGVIYNEGALPNFAEFDVDLATAGDYQLDVRYAAAEARPIKILINGVVRRSDAAGRVTGTWYPDSQTWFAEGIYRFHAGANTIRLERSEPFPHIDKFAIRPAPRTGQPRPSLDTASQPSAAQSHLASPQGEQGESSASTLLPEFVEQWVRYLEKTKQEPNSPLRAWHAATQLQPAPLNLQPVVELAVARTYQRRFAQTDEAWRARQSSPDGKNAKELDDPEQELLRKILFDSQGPFRIPPKFEAHYSDATRHELDAQGAELKELESTLQPLPEAMSVSEGKVEDLRIHLRGNHLTLGEPAARHFLSVLTNERSPNPGQNQSGRLELAQWLTDPANPLTARVMVNRIWRWHFGDGLVRSTDNFGRLGERPTHPELLDWLALRFVDSGWSIKVMHRTIMLSATYQQSSRYDDRAAEVDPENRLHWRANRRRLEAEAIRDAIVSVCGQLDCTMRGTLLDGANRTYVKGYPNSNYEKYDSNRRSVYLPVLRSMLYDVFQAFDFPDPSTPNGDRSTTTVAPQALFVLNSKLVFEQTQHLGREVLARSELDDADRVRLLYERAVGREPEPSDVHRSLAFVERYAESASSQQSGENDARVAAWCALCRAILGSNEFFFVD
jgi:hypothetical protein